MLIELYSESLFFFPKLLYSDRGEIEYAAFLNSKICDCGFRSKAGAVTERGMLANTPAPSPLLAFACHVRRKTGEGRENSATSCNRSTNFSSQENDYAALTLLLFGELLNTYPDGTKCLHRS